MVLELRVSLGMFSNLKCSLTFFVLGGFKYFLGKVFYFFFNHSVDLYHNFFKATHRKQVKIQ